MWDQAISQDLLPESRILSLTRFQKCDIWSTVLVDGHTHVSHCAKQCAFVGIGFFSTNWWSLSSASRWDKVHTSRERRFRRDIAKKHIPQHGSMAPNWFEMSRRHPFFLLAALKVPLGHKVGTLSRLRDMISSSLIKWACRQCTMGRLGSKMYDQFLLQIL